jgi:hypothetical protein
LHDPERIPQSPEAVVVIAAEQFKICPRRAAADAEAQSPARQRLDRLYPVRQLNRVAQRYLQHTDAELDALSDGGKRRQGGQRIEGGPPATHRIPDPDPRKSTGLDAAGIVGHTAEQSGVRLGPGAEPDHSADFHDISVFPNGNRREHAALLAQAPPGSWHTGYAAGCCGTCQEWLRRLR